ncbi:hypothetical protein ABIE26_000422 [Pedobacter africanus]|uniref:Uncharacterized protein n=1 Tax=Pedobacter africanus TaxID=151894 RepID=A0ACC6KVB1_9SPHI|nr:hypothetical protein [Pedobacter africanus]MDR6783090.1 hypothetical protein [Pedobacter africanus]
MNGFAVAADIWIGQRIRKDLSMLIRGNYDGDMINRFNKPAREVI